jgi:peptidyl-prolyl cis-trans isomerase C
MRRGYSWWFAASALGFWAAPVFSQQAPPAAAQQTPPAATPAARPAGPAPATPAASAPAPLPVPDRTVVAATVNGQPIMELALYRVLKRVPADKLAQARPEVLDFLVDNILIDQHLTQLKITVDPKDVEAKIKQSREEIQKMGSTMEKLMQENMVTEPELRTQITAQLRWEKFAAEQASDKALQEMFNGNRRLFDGSMVCARHILLSPAAGDAKAQADAKVQLAGFRKQVEDAAVQGVAKLPAATDNLEREKLRAKLTEDAFKEIAAKQSACPSKAQGGSLGWFPFSSMVEPFAKAAFALKPYQMSDVVATQFGYHLILVTDRRDGKEPKFEEVKEEVKDVFLDKLRESLLAKLRPAAKIVVNKPK